MILEGLMFMGLMMVLNLEGFHGEYEAHSTVRLGIHWNRNKSVFILLDSCFAGYLN